MRKAKIHWPPSDWDENDLHRDDHSRLPTRLHPFKMYADRETGLWTVYQRIDEREWLAITEGIEGVFSAFRAMLDRYEEWLPTRPISQVYFIGTELCAGAKVKIGISRRPDLRLRQLQTAHPEPLRIFVTAPGDRRDEERYHQRWKLRQLKGEWFTLGPPIIKEIERLRSVSA